MNKQQVRNYAVVKSFDALSELGKIKGRTDFSRFYFGRNADYFSMVLRGERLFSLGALHRLSKRLGHEIENEKDISAKDKLNECLSSLHSEIGIRLDRQASPNNPRKINT